MKARLWFAILFCSPVLLTSCSPRREPTGEVAFETRIVEKKAGPCGEAGQTTCAAIRIEYPEVTAAPAPLRGALTRDVSAWVQRPLLDGASLSSADALAAQFIANFERFRQEHPRAAAAWSMERTVRVLRQTPAFIAISLLETGYTGGAHSFSSLGYLNFDAATGRRLHLRDLLNPQATPALLSLAERHFRAARKLAPQADLAQEGFTFEGGRFALNQNFALLPEGLQMQYNTHEIGPYALGATAFLIPADELAPLLRAEFRHR